MIACTVALLLVSAGFVTYDLATFSKMMARDLSTLAESRRARELREV